MTPCVCTRTVVIPRRIRNPEEVPMSRERKRNRSSVPTIQEALRGTTDSGEPVDIPDSGDVPVRVPVALTATVASLQTLDPDLHSFIERMLEGCVQRVVAGGGGLACGGAQRGPHRFIFYVRARGLQDGGGPPEAVLVTTPADLPDLPVPVREEIERYMSLPGFFPA
jgi:hypothetical protein